MYSSSQGCHTATGTLMPHGITQCYLPPGRGDIPALTPAEAGTRLSDPGGMQGSRRKEVDRQFIGRSIDILVCVVCSFVKCHLKLRIDITLCGADCRVHVTVGCPSVCLSRRSTSATCCSPDAGSRYRSIAAGARDAAAGSVMSRAEVRG